jgi:hypothetical protein
MSSRNLLLALTEDRAVDRLGDTSIEFLTVDLHVRDATGRLWWKWTVTAGADTPTQTTVSRFFY